MNQDNTNEGFQFDESGKPKLPQGLKILTILTFIGSAISALFLIFYPQLNKFFLGFIDKAASSGKEFTASQLEDMEKGRAALELAGQNMIPLMVIGLASVALCFIGALWMRKLKKDGFWMYTAGELVPVAANFLLLGTAQFTGVMSVVMGVGIPLLFVFLYFTQRKYLIN